MDAFGQKLFLNDPISKGLRFSHFGLIIPKRGDDNSRFDLKSDWSDLALAGLVTPLWLYWVNSIMNFVVKPGHKSS